MTLKKQKLLWQLVVVALSLAASQTVSAATNGDTVNVPDGGTTALMLAAACLGIEAVRRKFNRS